MCYASPGPRCEAHAKERFEKISTKTSRKFNDLMQSARDKEKFEHEKPHAINTPTYERLTKKKNALRQETMGLIKKRAEARDEMDATSGGLDTLRRTLAATPIGDEHHVERLELMKRIDKGRKSYREKMLEYDKEHGTVNGRKPSNYGTVEGMEQLRAKTAKAHKAYDKAKTDEEKTAAWAKYRTADNAFVHARDTFERREKGLLPATGTKESTPEDKYKAARTEFEQADAEYREASQKREAVFKKIVDLEIEQASQGRVATTYSPNNPRSYTRQAAEDNNRWIDEDIALGKVVNELSDKRKTLRQKMKEAEAEKDNS